MINNAVWISWENQRRNREICKALKIRLYELHTIDLIKNPFKKYFLGVFKTFQILLKERPKIIFCQNPSLILSLFSVFYGKIFAAYIIVDSHNAGLFPREGRSKFLSFLSEFIQCQADLTIVTNSELKRYVETNGGRAFVLQDPIPRIPKIKKRTLNGKINILFICSYAEDEPYEIVIEASRNLDPDICIYITGDYKRKRIDPLHFPKNILFTGFVSENEYIELLNSVDATIDLTTRENCLVCGAYESVAVEKPMILSETIALKSYFNKGVIFTPNTVEGMKKAILEVNERNTELTAQVRVLKSKRMKEWEEKKRNLERILICQNL